MKLTEEMCQALTAQVEAFNETWAEGSKTDYLLQGLGMVERNLDAVPNLDLPDPPALAILRDLVECKERYETFRRGGVMAQVVMDERKLRDDTEMAFARAKRLLVEVA